MYPVKFPDDSCDCYSFDFPLSCRIVLLIDFFILVVENYMSALYRAELALSSAWLATDTDRWGLIEEKKTLGLFCENEHNVNMF